MAFALTSRELDWDAYDTAIQHTDGSGGRDQDIYWDESEIARYGGMREFLNHVAESEGADWGHPVLVSVYRRGSERETILCLTGPVSPASGGTEFVEFSAALRVSGNSIGVTVPAAAARWSNLGSGDRVKVRISKEE